MKMYAQLGWLLVLVGLVLGGSSAYAAQQFWVSLGSFSKVSGAAELHNRASTAFSQLSVVPSESAIGKVYRVVDGPVASREVARAKLEQARLMGISDAWLLVKDDTYVMPASVNEAELLASAPGVNDSVQSDDSYSRGYGLQDSASSVVLSGYSGTGESSAYSDANASGSAYADADYSGANADDDYVNLPLGKQELVEIAPAGYGLHQLRRDDAMPAGPAVESRLRDLEGIGRKQED